MTRDRRDEILNRMLYVERELGKEWMHRYGDALRANGRELGILEAHKLVRHELREGSGSPLWSLTEKGRAGALAALSLSA